MGFEPEQAAWWMGAGIAGASALAMGLVARIDIDGDAGVQAAIATFDDVQEPGTTFHGAGRGPELGGCARPYLPA